MQPSPWCVPSVAVILALVACRARAPEVSAPCQSDVDLAVCAAPDEVFTCRAFTWHVDACRGPLGCQAGHCDQRSSAEGDPCEVAGVEACSVDGTALLRCDGTAMTLTRRCRGDRACYRDTPDAVPGCDVGPAQAGDPCDGSKQLDRCGPDGKTLLHCDRTSHYVLARNCEGPRGCFPYVSTKHDSCGGGHFVACDVAVGESGEACEGYVGVGARSGSGGAYCSADRTKLLTCDEGTLVRRLDCACTVTWEPDGSAYRVGCGPDPVLAGEGRRERARVVAAASAVRLWGAEP